MPGALCALRFRVLELASIPLRSREPWQGSGTGGPAGQAAMDARGGEGAGFAASNVKARMCAVAHQEA